jgi:type II secretory pathway pseudopilin PulG
MLGTILLILVVILLMGLILVYIVYQQSSWDNQTDLSVLAAREKLLEDALKTLNEKTKSDTKTTTKTETTTSNWQQLKPPYLFQSCEQATQYGCGVCLGTVVRGSPSTVCGWDATGNLVNGGEKQYICQSGGTRSCPDSD